MFTQLFATIFLALAIVSSAVPLERRIADDPFLACGPPNNEDHKVGSSCAFNIHGPIIGAVADGHCVSTGDQLVCQQDD
ncbi:hypothetical protein DFH08DRAFT_972611 [Mycena albidolilacea]|uniref:Uncharacterized protein n=1 Tax=Mycena albidolilacea TaxID=1033008 RepID=A0AAD6ZBJ8_9AGAR|nr:hypothetical protein DFH08DRAFT_972611 [Mycena albidolilacea]